MKTPPPCQEGHGDEGLRAEEDERGEGPRARGEREGDERRRDVRRREEPGAERVVGVARRVDAPGVAVRPGDGAREKRVEGHAAGRRGGILPRRVASSLHTSSHSLTCRASI